MTDKDAMEKAAAMYVSGPNCEISDTFSSHCDTFEAGWKAAFSGPKVMALVEALIKVQRRCGSMSEARDIIDDALAEFEGEK